MLLFVGLQDLLYVHFETGTSYVKIEQTSWTYSSLSVRKQGQSVDRTAKERKNNIEPHRKRSLDPT